MAAKEFLKTAEEVNYQSFLTDNELVSPEWYDEILSKADFTMLVYMRGKWWPFCFAYAQRINTFYEQIKDARGQVYFLCSQSPAVCKEITTEWEMPYPCLSDEKNELAKHLKAQGLLDIKITTGSDGGPYTKGSWTYNDGMTQPAVLAVNKNQEVLYSWAINPAGMNLGGATDRPKVAEMVPYIISKANGGGQDANVKEPTANSDCCKICCIIGWYKCCRCCGWCLK